MRLSKPASRCARALAPLVFLGASGAAAGTQWVSLAPAAQDAFPGIDATIAVDYAPSDANPALTGLGLRLHWSSARLALAGLSEVLMRDRVGLDTRCLDDSIADFDGDPATDCYALIAWASLAGDWPGTTAQRLLSARFRSLMGAGQTAVIRVSASSTAAGQAFGSTAAQVRAATATLECDAGPVTLTGTFGPGTRAIASEQSIRSEGTVRLENGADLSLLAPRLSLPPTFIVASGASLRARATSLTCTASREDETAVTAAQSAAAGAEPLVAPLPIASAADLPSWAQDQLAALSIDPEAITHALLDAAGRWLLIETGQALDAADGNGVSDVYRLDLLGETLALLSRAPGGAAGNGPSTHVSADASGEWVVFQSTADDLVAGDLNGVSDIFLHDVRIATLTRLTGLAEQASAHPMVDAAGEELVYDQRDAAGRRRILLDTLWGAGAPSAVSASEDARGLPQDSHHPALSADGRFVAYLEEGGPEGARTCSVRIDDRDGGRYQRLACPAELMEAREQARPAFSADGRWLEWSLPGVEAPVRVPNGLLGESEETRP